MRASRESRERITVSWLSMTAWISDVRSLLFLSSQSTLCCSNMCTIWSWSFRAATWSGLSQSLAFSLKKINELSLWESEFRSYEFWLIFMICFDWAKSKSQEESAKKLLITCSMIVLFANDVCEIEAIDDWCDEELIFSRLRSYERRLSRLEESRSLKYWEEEWLCELHNDVGE